MGTLWQDVQYGIRMLRKAPRFTTIALVTLALGIGANTIMFGVVNAVLLRPINVHDPDRLVGCFVRSKGYSFGEFAYSSYLDARDNNTVFSDLMAYSLRLGLARTIAGLALAFGAMALFLAALGIYGIKGHLVASRTPEIGIRMALGATRWSVLALVLREGAALTLVGLSLGMLLAFAMARVIRSALCGVDPIDPVSIGTTLALLASASLLASLLPARRAARIDPMAALRYE